MKPDIKVVLLMSALVVFVVFPLGLYVFGDVARRSSLNELASIVTLLGFFLMLGQFILTRSDEGVITLCRTFIC